MLEHLFYYAFVPGKLENILAIMDVEKIGVLSLPMSVIFFI